MRVKQDEFARYVFGNYITWWYGPRLSGSADFIGWSVDHFDRYLRNINNDVLLDILYGGRGKIYWRI